MEVEVNSLSYYTFQAIATKNRNDWKFVISHIDCTKSDARSTVKKFQTWHNVLAYLNRADVDVDEKILFGKSMASSDIWNHILNRGEVVNYLRQLKSCELYDFAKEINSKPFWAYVISSENLVKTTALLHARKVNNFETWNAYLTRGDVDGGEAMKRVLLFADHRLVDVAFHKADLMPQNIYDFARSYQGARGGREYALKVAMLIPKVVAYVNGLKN